MEAVHSQRQLRNIWNLEEVLGPEDCIRLPNQPRETYPQQKMASNLRNVSTEEEFDKAASTSGTVSLTTLFQSRRLHHAHTLNQRLTRRLILAQAAVYFWAHWCQPCKQLDEVFAELAKDSQQAIFIRVRSTHRALYDIRCLSH